MLQMEYVDEKVLPKGHDFVCVEDPDGGVLTFIGSADPGSRTLRAAQAACARPAALWVLRAPKQVARVVLRTPMTVLRSPARALQRRTD